MMPRAWFNGRCRSASFALVLMLASCGDDGAVNNGDDDGGLGKGGSDSDGGNGSLQSIPGPADDPVRDHLRDIGLPPADPDWFTWLGEPGRRVGISRREIAVVLEPSTTVAEANDLLGALDAEIAGARAGAGLLLLRLPDAPTPAPILAAWRDLLDDERVAAAMVEDAVLYPERLPANWVDHRGPPRWVWDTDLVASGGNWALEAARLPQVWNLTDYLVANQLAPPSVAVVDSGFASEHEDLDGFTAPAQESGAKRDHGTMVTGVIAAVWSNATGVAGAFPVPVEVRPFVNPGLEPQHEDDPGEVPIGNSRALDVLLRIIGDDDKQDIQVVNNSYGMSQIFCPGAPASCVYPEGDEVSWFEYLVDISVSWSVYMDRWGDVYQEAIAQALAERKDRKILFFSSSGNCGSGATGSVAPPRNGYDCARRPGQAKSYVYSARDNSPLSNLAIRFPGEHYVAIGSVDWTGARSEFSNWPDTLAAGGDLVRSTEDPDDGIDADMDPNYKTDVGTSFSSPLAAAVAGLLWSFDPELTPAEVIDRMLSSAATTTAGQDEIRSIDAFAAVLSLDDVAGRDDLHVALADIDDGDVAAGGTADGNLRWSVANEGCATREQSAAARCEVQAAPTRRGDGNVDIRDFRVLRDAILQSTGTTLDGFERNPKKDLNQDGCVTLDGTARRALGSDVNCRDATRGDAPDENVYPRADLNGDGVVGNDVPAGGGMTDLEVLQAEWGKGTAPITLDLAAGDLDELLLAGDIHLDLSEFAALDATTATVKAPGLADFEVTDFAADATVLTTSATGTLEIEVRVKKASEQIACVRAEIDAPGPGEDVVARPNQSCSASEFWLENRHANLKPSPCLDSTCLCNCPELTPNIDHKAAPADSGNPGACLDTPDGARIADGPITVSSGIGGATNASSIDIATTNDAQGTTFTFTYHTVCTTAPDGNAHSDDQIAVRLATSLSQADAQRYSVTVTCDAMSTSDSGSSASFVGPGGCILQPGVPGSASGMLTGTGADGLGVEFTGGCSSNSSISDPAHEAQVDATLTIAVTPP